MAATFRLHTQLTWPGLERPAPQDLAANLAARLRAEDFRQVIQDGPTVQYSKGPRASSRWNPLSYAPSGTVLISSTPEGFEFDCRLGSGRLVITIALHLWLVSSHGWWWVVPGLSTGFRSFGCSE